LPLRGHRDDGALDSETKLSSCLAGHEGVFRALLAFRVDAGDRDLQEHLSSAPKNMMMISKTIQNEIITTIGDVIRSKIVAKIKKAKFYSLLADETTDVSVTEQMTICIRYVDELETSLSNKTETSGLRPKYILREDFLGFVEVTNATGENLAKLLVTELQNAGVPLTYLRGQGYDGGSNMSGKNKGVQSLIIAQQPLAFYTHCFNHALSLCVGKACDVVPVRNMVGIVITISWFLHGSAKRVNMLSEIISRADNVAEYKKKKLKGLCETRWVERHECFQTFDDLLIFIAECLEILENDRDRNVSSKAAGYSAAIKRSDFLVALKVVNKLNSHTIILSQYLQAPTLEISNAIKQVDHIITTFKEFRERDTAFDEIYQEAIDAAASLQVEIQTPRVCNRQINRSNVVAVGKTPIEYYFKCTIFYPFLDHYLTALNDRFKGEFLKVIPLEGLIPKNLSELTEEKRKNIICAAQIYAEDLELLNDAELTSEIRLWVEYWKENDAPPTTAVESLEHCTFFPKIKVLLNILAVLPVTSATPERTFSALKRLKTYLRATMKQPRLNGLALAHIHKDDVHVEVPNFIDVFAQKKPRRMMCADWS
jgi:hypothetical protein